MKNRLSLLLQEKTFFVFLISLFLYLSFRSYYLNFDGIACAIAVELSDFKHLVHGNHLAYGVLVWLFDFCWRVLGYQGRAILPLQIFSTILGATSAAVFYSFLRRIGNSQQLSLLISLCLAVSQAWWFWSLEAQVYMLGVLFVALCVREVFSNKPNPKLIGIYHGVAILGHVGHLMLAPALIWRLRKKSRNDVYQYLLTLASAIFAAYVLAGLLAVRPQSFQQLKIWLLGSSALGVSRTFAWHGGLSISGVIEWVFMSARIFCDFRSQIPLVYTIGLLLALIPLGLALTTALKQFERSRFWVYWILGYALLYISWEPATVVYRISDLWPMWVLVVIGISHFKIKNVAVVLWLIAAFSYNLAFNIYPASKPQNNIDYSEAQWIAEHAPGNAWVLANGPAVVYLPYFTGRRALNLRYFSDENSLDQRLDLLSSQQQDVFVSGRTMDLSGIRDQLNRYGLALIDSNDQFQLYQIKRKEVLKSKS